MKIKLTKIDNNLYLVNVYTNDSLEKLKYNSFKMAMDDADTMTPEEKAQYFVDLKENPTDVRSSMTADEVEYVDMLAKARSDRHKAYPSLGDQLDMLFHEIAETGSISRTGQWYQKIKEVKEDNPKP